MFRQQINLCKAFTKPPPAASLLSWKRFWLMNAGYAILLFFVAIGSTIHLHSLNGQLDALTIQHNLLQKKFATVKNHYPAIFFSQEVEKNIDQLQLDLAAEEKMLASISHKTNFSIYLNMLSELIVPQTWLTSFTISNQGDAIDLYGESLTANSIQLFLNNLLAEKILHDYTLNIKKITQNTTANQRNFEFEITAVKKS